MGFGGVDDWLQNGFGGGKIDIDAVNKYNDAIESGVESQKAFADATANANKNTVSLIASANGARVSDEALGDAVQATTLKMRAQELGVKLLSTALNVGLMLAISVVIKAITEITQASEQMSQQAAEATKEYQEHASAISDYKKQITDLKTALDDENISYTEARDKRSQLLDVQKKLIDTYGSEAHGIDLVNGSLDEQIQKLEEMNEIKRKEWENDVNKLTTGQKWQRFGGTVGLVLGNIATLGLQDEILKSLGYSTSWTFWDDFDNKKSNIDRITEKVENFNKTIRVNAETLKLPQEELDNLTSQLNSYEGVLVKDNKITFSGDAKTVANTIAKIQTQVIGSREDLKELDQQLKTIYESAQKIVDENWDTYNQAIENKILDDDKGLEYYGKLTQAAENYQDALKSGNEVDIEKAAKDYMAILTEISDSNLPDTFKKHFENMFPELSDVVKSWTFEVNIKPKIENNEDNIRGYIQQLQGMTTDEIAAAFDNNGEGVSKEIWDAITALNAVAQDNGLDLSDFLAQLREAGYLVSQLDKDTESAIQNAKDKFGGGVDWGEFFKEYSIDTEEELDKWNEVTQGIDNAEEAMEAYKNSINNVLPSLEELNKQLDNIQSAYDTVKSAIEEYNEQGFISVDTYQALASLEPEYLGYLMDEEGNLSLTTDALNKKTEALIDNLAHQQMVKIVDYVAGLSEEERQLYLTKAATDKASESLTDFAAATISAKFAAGDLSEEELKNLQTMLAGVINWAESAKANLNKSLGKSSGGSSQKNNEDKLADAWKTEHLETLKEGLKEQEQILNEYKKNLEIFDFGLETVETDDFSSRADLLMGKIDGIIDYGKAMRAEFDRVAETIPETADEAQELANRLETLGSDMRSNVTDLRKTQIELQKLQIEMVSTLVDDRTKELDSILNNIDKRINILNSEHQDAFKYVNEMLSMDLLLPTYSDADKKRREKRRTDKALIETEQETQDKINEIVEKSLQMQFEENREAREEERQELTKDMQKTATIVRDGMNTVADIVNKTNLKPKIDTTDIDEGLQTITGKIRSWFDKMGIDYPILFGGSDNSNEPISPLNPYTINGVPLGSNIGKNKSGGLGGTSANTSPTHVPKGAVVALKWTDEHYAKKKREGATANYGHIGFSDGNGGFISATGNGKISNWSLADLAAGRFKDYAPGFAWGYVDGKVLDDASANALLSTAAKGSSYATGGNCLKWVGDVYDKTFGVSSTRLPYATAVMGKWTPHYAVGTPNGNAQSSNLGIAGENYKPEILIDKTTGEKTYIDSPTIIDTSKTDVIGEKQTANLPKFADGTYSKDELKKQLEALNKDDTIDFTIRPIIDTSELEKAGWGEQEDGFATVYSSTFYSEDFGLETGKALVVTPILPNGEVLSPEELEKYAEDILSGKQIDAKIKMGLFDGEGYKEAADEFANKVHELHEQYFTDEITEATVGRIEAFYDHTLDKVGKISSTHAKSMLAISNDESLSGYEKKHELYKEKLEIEDEAGGVIKTIYEELRNQFSNWLDEVDKDSSKWSLEVYNEYRDTLEAIKDYGLKLAEDVDQIMTDMVESRWKLSDDYISERNFYNDWSLFDDNEVKAWERVVKWLKEDYPNDLERIKRAEKNLFEARKEAFNDANNYANTYLDSQKTLLQDHFDILNSIEEAHHDINKELETSKTMYEWLDDESRQLLFNQEDYNKLNKELNEIQRKATIIQDKYEYDLSHATLETIESITNEYDRQYKTLMKSYEIAKADLEIAKKKQKLNNVLNERNVRMFINGSWQWVANTQDVIDAKSELADAEYAKRVEESGLKQQESIDAITKRQDELNVVIKKFENGVISLDEAVSSAREAIGSIPSSVRKLYESAYIQTKSTNSNSGSTVKSYNGTYYDSTVDYMSKIQSSETLQEALNYNKSRNAKIDGEGLGTTKLSTVKLIQDYYQQNIKNKYASGTSYTEGGLTALGENGYEAYINNSGHLIPINHPMISNVPSGGIVFNQDQMKNLRTLWDVSNINLKGGSGLIGGGSQTIDNSQDNRIIINGMTVDSGSSDGQALISALRRYVGNH